MSKAYYHPREHLLLFTGKESGQRILVGDLERGLERSTYTTSDGQSYALARSPLFNVVGKAPGDASEQAAQDNFVHLLEQKLCLLDELEQLPDFLRRHGFDESAWSDKEQERYCAELGVPPWPDRRVVVLPKAPLPSAFATVERAPARGYFAARRHGGRVIEYVQGDATRPAGQGRKVIVHVVNTEGAWGAGFVLALSRRWSVPEVAYRSWSRGRGTANDGPFALGEVQFVSAEPGIIVANLVGQQGIGWKDGVPPVRYDAVRKGLSKVADHAIANGATVHMPRIGCGLGGGRWDEVAKIVEQELVAKGVQVTVYDL